jgi:unsaturated rhamnogalacturonyl hydrolase
MKTRIALLCLALCIFSAGTAQSQSGTQKNPAELARVLVDRVMRETSFDLVDSPQKAVLDIQVVDWGNVFGPTEAGVAYALSSLRVEKDTALAFGLSRDVPLKIWLNGKEVYRSNSRTDFLFKEFSYEMFRFNDTVRLLLNKGENRILIKGLLPGKRSAIYLRELFPARSHACARFDAGSIDPSFNGKSWIYCGMFGTGEKARLDVAFAPEIGFKLEYAMDGKQYGWRSSVARKLKEISIKPDAAFKRESYAEWQYPNGTVMLSLLSFADATRDKTVLGFVQRFCDFTLENLSLVRKQYEQLHAFRGMNHRLIRLGMLDDTGAPALPFIEMLLRTHDRRLEPVVADVARYVSTGQLRLPDGTFCREEKLPNTIWADDLFMSTPFLVRMGRLKGDQKYFDDAARQVLNFSKYLEDKTTGLYHHAWYDGLKQQSPICWGRANGWIVWATSEILGALPRTHPLRAEISRIFVRHLKALAAFQAPTGLWHQVLDRPDSFEETSCTAMFIIGMTRGIKMGILDSSFEPVLLKAWAGLQSRIGNDGIVKDICRGTEIGDDFDFYNKRERFDNDPRGLGAVITACVEMSLFQVKNEPK